MHSRALSARDRVILKKRMPQVLDFMRMVKPEDFMAEMQAVCSSQISPVTEMHYQVFQQVSSAAA